MKTEITYEIVGDSFTNEFDPEEYVNCENIDSLELALVELGEEKATWGIRIDVPISELWKMVEEKRKELNQPFRVVRSRSKGWKMPENTKSVCRPGKFGNPYKTASHFRRMLTQAIEGTIDLSVDTQNSLKMQRIASELEELRGFNLACFCKLEKDCHADVLLEFSNKKD